MGRLAPPWPAIQSPPAGAPREEEKEEGRPSVVIPTLPPVGWGYAQSPAARALGNRGSFGDHVRGFFPSRLLARPVTGIPVGAPRVRLRRTPSPGGGSGNSSHLLCFDGSLRVTNHIISVFPFRHNHSGIPRNTITCEICQVLVAGTFRADHWVEDLNKIIPGLSGTDPIERRARKALNSHNSLPTDLVAVRRRRRTGEPDPDAIEGNNEGHLLKFNGLAWSRRQHPEYIL